MAEEEAVAVAPVAVSPSPADHKRKLEDLELEAPEPPESSPKLDSNENSSNLKTDSDEIKKAEEVFPDLSEAKRARIDDKPDVPANENGSNSDKEEEPAKEDTEKSPLENDQSSGAQDNDNGEHPQVITNEEVPAEDNYPNGDMRQPTGEDPQLDEAQPPSGDQLQEPSADISQTQWDDPSLHQLPTEEQTMSRKMEVPNNKVGVLIGKAGDTIRFLQYNSGAKIQITRDAEADPHSSSRPVELLGSLESINKAEKLIKDVIAEADAGGSPSLVARGFGSTQAAGASEQIQIQIPNEKVGLVIGKGGETIKNLQTRSGARIQLIPQHLPDGDHSKERTVRVTGDKRQIEIAREMIKEVMNQTVRSSPLSSGSSQQAGYRPRGPSGAPQWGTRGGHPMQPTSYDHQQRGPYPSQHSHYQPPAYGNYPPQQQLGPRSSSFGPGWEQRPPYDSPSLSHPNSAPAPSQPNYNYGQPHGSGYGQPAPYSQTAPVQQGYGHGYNEPPKYENQGPPMQQPYGSYPQSGGYPPQQQYGKPPSYGMPPQVLTPQSYGPPRASQPGDVPYQGSNMAPQQSYPYASGGPPQQTYPAYGGPATDGYNQAPPTASAPGYAPPPVSGYSQPAVGYGQAVPPGGYGQYSSSQPGYSEQPAQNNAAYGYQGPTEPGYNSGVGSGYGAPASGQPGYIQPVPAQPVYDQSVPQSGGYGSAPVGYGKASLSPQAVSQPQSQAQAQPQPQPQAQPGYTQYDSSQMYGAHR